jgi:hypothetical protein
MPNDLTPLNPDNPIQSGMDLDEEMTKFMVATVLPEMAKMLGKPHPLRRPWAPRQA